MAGQSALRGRATGVVFFAVFGALWLVFGLAARQWLSAMTAGAVAIGLGLLIADALILYRRVAALPASTVEPEEQRRIGRTFGRVNAVQWTAIIVIAVVLGRMHLDAYTPAAVTVVVGLHFFPLARIFRSPQHHLTGAVLVAWGVLCAVLVPREVLQSTTAFGTGAVLWASAGVTLARAFRRLQAPRPAGG
jgi:hypothetical protein